MKEQVYDKESLKIIDSNISKAKKALPYSSKTKVITRNDFLNLTYKYLVIDYIDT
jgi:hypothetical protein